jgi:hypothetical protein
LGVTLRVGLSALAFLAPLRYSKKSSNKASIPNAHATVNQDFSKIKTQKSKNIKKITFSIKILKAKL